MSYLVYARKWRPKSFESIVGQEHVVTTLKNSISRDRIAHSYLFSGSRGIGKTTTARIFAMGLNCEEGPTASACGKCSSCVEIMNGTNLDVIEIDGASNRGIDEIRSLRENVKFVPSRGRFKVYIIDEVHMLTEEAFNALLKTLEEPPLHVIFIFATTHSNKVPATILSRCQVFDFKRLDVREISGKLSQIARNENLEVEEEVFYTIARAAEGSMRDAEFMLDQLVSFCGNKITVESAVSILGIIGQELLFEFTAKIINKDTPGILRLVDSVISAGKDIPQFIGCLVGHFRNLLIAKTGGEISSLMDLPKDMAEKVILQSASFTNEELLYLLSVLTNAQEAVRRTASQRIPLELALIRITQRDKITPLSSILNRLSELENRLGCTVSAKSSSEPESPLPRSASQKDHPAVIPGTGGTKQEEKAEIKEDPSGVALQVEDPPQAGEDISFETICRQWQSLIKDIAFRKMSVAMFLREAQPLQIEDDVLTVGLGHDKRFHKEALESNGNRKIIEDGILKLLNLRVSVNFKLVETIDRKAEVEEEILPEEEEKEIHKVIRSALDIFGGSLKSGE